MELLLEIKQVENNINKKENKINKKDKKDKKKLIFPLIDNIKNNNINNENNVINNKNKKDNKINYKNDNLPDMKIIREKI